MTLRTSIRLATLATLTALAALVACSTSSATGDGGVDGGHEAGNGNGCVTAGAAFNYVCQSGTSCKAGYVNIQDYECSSGELCCGPLGEGGFDVSADVNVFVDSPVFEVSTGAPDTGHDSGHDAGVDAPSSGHTDAGHDGSAPTADSGKDAGGVAADGATDAGRG